MSGGLPFQEVLLSPRANPIADAVRLGPILYAPAITGRDPGSGALAEDFEGQLRQALQNLQAVLELAKAGLEHVGHVTVYMTDLGLRPILNDMWAELYP